jgi:hypothetical protein
MPDKDSKGTSLGVNEVKSRSAQSGPPDDKERDRTQRGDEVGQEDGPNPQRATKGDEGEAAENDHPGETDAPGRRTR